MRALNVTKPPTIVVLLLLAIAAPAAGQWPRVIQGRTDLMTAFRGYVDNIALQSADQLIVHKTNDSRVVVIEYEVHGTILATGVKYTIGSARSSGSKIERSRTGDYMDSLTAWNALIAQAH